MASQSSDPAQPDLAVEQCLRGNTAALAALRHEHHHVLAKILMARGATATETDDILADLWADCVPGRDDQPSLLEKFKWKCTLGGWLATVATNRWIDLKRRQERRGELSQSDNEEPGRDLLERLPASVRPSIDDSLAGLLRDSLQAAFAACTPKAIAFLRLVYVHGLTQREVGQMLGWGEWKVSRFLSEAMTRIEENTLRSLKQRDPWLELTWQDFVDLCQTYELGFL